VNAAVGVAFTSLITFIKIILPTIGRCLLGNRNRSSADLNRHVAIVRDGGSAWDLGSAWGFVD